MVGVRKRLLNVLQQRSRIAELFHGRRPSVCGDSPEPPTSSGPKRRLDFSDADGRPTTHYGRQIAEDTDMSASSEKRAKNSVRSEKGRRNGTTLPNGGIHSPRPIPARLSSARDNGRRRDREPIATLVDAPPTTLAGDSNIAMDEESQTGIVDVDTDVRGSERR